jgi:hypothetical protein
MTTKCFDGAEPPACVLTQVSRKRIDPVGDVAGQSRMLWISKQLFDVAAGKTNSTSLIHVDGSISSTRSQFDAVTAVPTLGKFGQ